MLIIVSMHEINTNIVFLSFIRFELLSFEHGSPILHKMLHIILWLFCHFSHILSISGKPHLFSWELLDSLILVCTS